MFIVKIQYSGKESGLIEAEAQVGLAIGCCCSAEQAFVFDNMRDCLQNRCSIKTPKAKSVLLTIISKLTVLSQVCGTM